jgi:hypothetical protein
MPETEEMQPPIITYIPQANRTIVIRVHKPGEDPFELIADVYSEEELHAMNLLPARQSKLRT